MVIRKIRKFLYERSKGKFEKMAKYTGQGFKCEYAEFEEFNQRFGVDLISFSLAILSLCFLFGTVILPATIIDLPINFLGFEIDFLMLLIIGISLCVVTSFMSTYIAGKYGKTDFVKDFLGALFGMSYYIVAVLIIGLVFAKSHFWR